MTRPHREANSTRRMFRLPFLLQFTHSLTHSLARSLTFQADLAWELLKHCRNEFGGRFPRSNAPFHISLETYWFGTNAVP